jgi:FAD/FMN-containing dehydrogenase
VHSQLNATHVRSIESPRTVDGLRATLLEAKRSGRSVSICGGRHSMGGQQFGAGTVLIDTRSLNRVLAFDRVKGEVTVEGGIQWPALLEFLETAQQGEPRRWGIYQKQTGADRLTLAGALSCNAHGRGLSMPPIADQVEAIELLDARGELVTCSRTCNPNLFSLAVGGYGLFGIITRVTLRLRPGCKVRRVVSVTDATGLMERLAEHICDGFEYGDFQFAIDPGDESFLSRGVLSCYQPVAAETPLTKGPVHFSAEDWVSLAIEAHRDKRRAFERYASAYLRTSGQVYWSDAQLSGPYLDDYHAKVDKALGAPVKGTEMITELFVPRSSFEAFMSDAREVLRRRNADVIYGTVRLIEPDTDTFLAWAREPYACVVLNLHVDHTELRLSQAIETFRRLIDTAISHGGSYYLTYHPWARLDQVERCYPQMRAFLEAKRRHDPNEVFQSDWYRRLKAMYRLTEPWAPSLAADRSARTAG